MVIKKINKKPKHYCPFNIGKSNQIKFSTPKNLTLLKIKENFVYVDLNYIVIRPKKTKILSTEKLNVFKKNQCLLFNK